LEDDYLVAVAVLYLPLEELPPYVAHADVVVRRKAR
ncbi:unnamed protein product, partial [marine sediment metagenome]